MGDVVELGKKKALGSANDDTSQWATGPARCMDCKHEWIAVAPAGTRFFECPSCASGKGFFKHPFYPEEDTYSWACNCGNDLFFVQTDGILCPGCGTLQSFPR
jgi:DNA-directed RNA polymerase subunit RPC12/RpoP